MGSHLEIRSAVWGRVLYGGVLYGVTSRNSTMLHGVTSRNSTIDARFVGSHRWHHGGRPGVNCQISRCDPTDPLSTNLLRTQSPRSYRPSRRDGKHIPPRGRGPG